MQDPLRLLPVRPHRLLAQALEGLHSQPVLHNAHYQVSLLASQRSASSAAAQPVPAAVTACR